MLLYSPSPIFFQFTYRILHTYSCSKFYIISFTEKLKARTVSLFSLHFFQVKHLTSCIQLACEFNQIIQLSFTLQKLRYKSTLVKLGTIEALDKPFTNTNGKTLLTRGCSNTVKLLLTLIPHYEHFVLYSRDYIQISKFLPTFTKIYFFFFYCDLGIK